MVSILKFIVRIASIVNEWVGRSVSWLTLILVLLVCFDVGRRHILNSSKSWGMELEWHLFAAIFLLGAGYAFKHDRHVRVDLFYSKFNERDKALTNLIGNLLFLMPWCILIIMVSYDYAAVCFEILEGSPNPDGLPFRFIIKACIPIGFSLILLQALANISESILMLMHKNRNPL